MTGYVPAPSDVAVWQLVAEMIATQSVEPPELNVTVPVAPTGSPESDSVSCEPYTMDDGAAASVKVGVALVMVSVVVVVCDVKFESPEYVAVTVSVPTGAFVAVQLSVGSVAVQSVVPPMLKVTDPVALEGSAAV